MHSVGKPPLEKRHLPTTTLSGCLVTALAPRFGTGPRTSSASGLPHLWRDFLACPVFQAGRPPQQAIMNGSALQCALRGVPLPTPGPLLDWGEVGQPQPM